MSTPKRIQRQRTKGWRTPEGAIYVGRPTRWGNPWRALPTADGWGVFARTDNGLEWWLQRVGIVSKAQAIAITVEQYRMGIVKWAEDEYGSEDEPDPVAYALDDLRGHDLACWCPLDQPCHADVLLELANR